MKYIRTKDDIWCYDEKEKVAIQPETENHDTKVLINPKFIKKANTIEELVDGYVIELKANGEKTYKSNLCSEDLDFNLLLKDHNIYGAIWVGADLLSKAKMNEKGELELL